MSGPMRNRVHFAKQEPEEVDGGKKAHLLVVDVPEVVHALDRVVAAADGLVPVLVIPPENAAALADARFGARPRPRGRGIPAAVDTLQQDILQA